VSAATRPFPHAVFGLSHVDVPVARLDASVRFYADGLGLAERQRGPGWADLDASSASIRLVETASPERRAALRVQVAEVEPVFRALLAAGGRGLCEPARTDGHELAASAQDPDGNVVTVWRPLSEDEYGYLPALPTQTEWTPEAERLLQSLLLAVPALFRGLARRKVVRLAEELCSGRVIAPADVVRAYVLASAKVTRHRLREPLRRHGYDPEAFRAEFEAD
jgi:catechol 2,3-dioxygenase-like lactoylglutathione lyase family enzyme